MNQVQVKHHYVCKGCGKEYNTYKEYEHGWICLKCRDTVKVNVKCSECGVDVPILWDTYRMKDPNIPWRCRACNDKYRNAVYDAKSEEEKKAFVEKQAARSKEYWANLSKEEKEKDSQRRKELWKHRYETGEAERLLSAMKEGRKQWWNSLTSEQKEKQLEYLQTGRSVWWDALSDDEKYAYHQEQYQYLAQWQKGLTEEDRLKLMEPLREGHKEFWENMTVEKFQQMKLESNLRYLEHLKNPTEGRYNSTPNNNELDLINEFNKNKIEYIFQYPSIKMHPDFNKLFPYNPVSYSKFISPYHMWDFKIHTLEGDVFVDIDGSVHDNSKKGISTLTNDMMVDLNKLFNFNDSQRPYQTDGLPAYAILCYDDRLTNNTPVIRIDTGERMDFKTFISIIDWMNKTESEKREILKLAL